jgi:hypothetical protein
MITNLLLLLLVAVVIGLSVGAGYWLREACTALLSYAHDIRANLEDANRLTSRLIELETEKQANRKGGRALLQEHIAARVAQAVEARAKG